MQDKVQDASSVQSTFTGGSKALSEVLSSGIHREGLHVAGVHTEDQYISQAPWSSERPHVLVVACSDGRLQRNLDDFLNHHLGIRNYDRMYMPGGPGALAASGDEPQRTEQMRSQGLFLIEAHVIQDLLLVFHGAAANGDSWDGPTEACCADYKRKLPELNIEQINAQHEADYLDILHRINSTYPQVRVRGFRAEVIADGRVRFTQRMQD